MIEPGALPVSLCIFLLVISYSGIISFIRAFGEAEGINTGTIFLVYAVFLLIFRPFAGRLQDRKGDNAVVYPGILMQAAGVALMAWRPCMATLILAAFGTAMGFGNLSACIVVTAGGYQMMYFAAALVSLLALPLYHMVWGRRKI